MNDAARPPLAERLQDLRQLLLGDDETPLDPPPSVIFVGGAARTGTTLLQNVLCSSGVTNPVIAEAAPVRFLLESHRLTGNHTRVHTGAYFASKDSLDDYYRGVFDSLFAHLRELHACRVLVLKEPELTKHFVELMRLIPQACFVVAVRDPRDVVTSMLDWGERSRREGRSHLFQQRDMAALAEFYLAFYRRFWMDFPRELLARLRFVRYEDLVHDPQGMGRRLQRYTGVPLADYDPTREWRHVKLSLDQRTSPIRDALTEHYGKPVTEAKVGAWREALNDTEAAEVMQICRPIRVAFNYRP